MMVIGFGNHMSHDELIGQRHGPIGVKSSGNHPDAQPVDQSSKDIAECIDRGIDQDMLVLTGLNERGDGVEPALVSGGVDFLSIREGGEQPTRIAPRWPIPVEYVRWWVAGCGPAIAVPERGR